MANAVQYVGASFQFYVNGVLSLSWTNVAYKQYYEYSKQASIHK